MKLTESEPDFPKNRTRKHKKSFWRYVPFAVSILVLLVAITGIVYSFADEPRRDVNVISNIEANGGEVIKIVHRSGKAGQGYVDATFDGKQSRCVLHLLDQNPPVFDCDPAINR